MMLNRKMKNGDDDLINFDASNSSLILYSLLCEFSLLASND